LDAELRELGSSHEIAKFLRPRIPKYKALTMMEIDQT
jgi:hypothetical protein